MLGTLAASVAFTAYLPNANLLQFVLGAIFATDMIYVVAIYRKYRELGLAPWLHILRRPGPALRQDCVVTP